VKDEKEDVLDREKYDGGKTKTRAKDVFTKDTPQASPQKHPPGHQRSGAVRCCCTLFAASPYHSYAAGVTDGSAKRIFLPGDLNR